MRTIWVFFTGLGLLLTSCAQNHSHDAYQTTAVLKPAKQDKEAYVDLRIEKLAVKKQDTPFVVKPRIVVPPKGQSAELFVGGAENYDGINVQVIHPKQIQTMPKLKVITKVYSAGTLLSDETLILDLDPNLQFIERRV
ncbi:MAG: hypothetical protein CMO81_03035 [Waddliaceae bacterium]|nr:hypothetical protein [Waddliaceae bacterium]